jgi:hypothetical protein
MDITTTLNQILELAFYVRPSISYDYEYEISAMQAGWQ